jgi:amino acid transporter
VCAQCRNPGKDMPLGIIGGTGVCTILYIIMCIVICMMVPYADIDTGAPFSAAFGYVGLTWAKCAPSFGLQNWDNAKMTPWLGVAMTRMHPTECSRCALNTSFLILSGFLVKC